MQQAGLYQGISTLAKAKASEVHDLYKDLHAHPELSMQEFRTSALIREQLESLGLEVLSCGVTGVVGLLRNGEGPVVAYRADFDGLPIQEDTGLDYASTAKGHLPDGTEVPLMHGCGHDFHVSIAIATIKLLLEIRDRWSGTLVFIFQPGEETGEGALAMVEDGLWERVPQPHIIFAQHVNAEEAGVIGVTKGVAMANSDSWSVRVHGKGGHGSQPQTTIDPVLLAANMVIRIQQIVSREVSAQDNLVITVGTFHAGLKENIIPNHADFSLNMRSFDPEVRLKALAALRRIINGEAQVAGAPAPTIEESGQFPECYNDPEATTALLGELSSALGQERVRSIPPVMASEDFGYLSAGIGIPSVYWNIGGFPAERAAAGEAAPGNHSPHFAPVIEPTMTTGVEAAAVALLSQVGKLAG